MSFINNIVNEFNPSKDMNLIKYDYEHFYNENIDPIKGMKNGLNNIINIFSGFLKPMVRGQLIGGSIGAFTSYLGG